MRADYRCPRRVTGHGLPLVRSQQPAVRYTGWCEDRELPGPGARRRPQDLDPLARIKVIVRPADADAQIDQ